MPGAVPKVAMLAAGVAAAGAACVGYGILVERDWYRLRRERVEALAPGQAPLTVLHLSDLHMTAADTRRMAFLERLATEPVDLVVLTGDMLGEPAGLGPVLETLGRFRPRLGAVAVLGSNDYFAPRFRNPLTYFMGPSSRRRRSSPRNPWRELVEGLEARGWTVLANRRGQLGDVELAGMDDPHIRRDDPEVLVPANGDASTRLRLGVVHSPYRRALDAFAGNGYDLVLAGHTHGGQVRLPGVGALVTNCDLPRDQVRGLSRWGSSWLHVSAGLGTSKYAPFRFACRPEASLLTVVSKA
ncbi:MAG: metallophosphoesterase family protein [Actinomycetota bacterium]|nr:metallophosphoesterase family protein [Actinomycetota bacterium]